jgi:hypothetical protein
MLFGHGKQARVSKLIDKVERVSAAADVARYCADGVEVRTSCEHSEPAEG